MVHTEPVPCAGTVNKSETFWPRRAASTLASNRTGLVTEESSQRTVDLGQGKIRVLKMDFLGTPAVSDFVRNDFSDLHLRPGDPGYASAVS